MGTYSPVQVNEQVLGCYSFENEKDEYKRSEFLH
jgi:hypothetical protein